jgi:hypothetical protein
MCSAIPSNGNSDNISITRLFLIMHIMRLENRF